MNESTKHLGILTKVQEVQNIRGTFTKAWIKRADSKLIFFHQDSLMNTSEANRLADGQFILFNTKVKRGEKRDLLNAINCVVAQPVRLLSFLLDSDTSAISFIRKHAGHALLLTLHNEAEQLEARLLDSQQVKKLANIKSQLAQQPIPKSKPPQPELIGLSVINRPESVDGVSRFLHNMFAANSPEYNQRLFSLLTEGIKTINDSDSYTYARLLLEFNDHLAEGHLLNLHSKFYELASAPYRFQFWLQGVVPYCDTDVLLTEFVNGDAALRSSILSRCPADKLDLLTSTNKSEKPSIQVEAHFNHIKDLLLVQLNSASTSIQVAVAWFTHDELFGLLCYKLRQGVQVELVLNNDYINNWEYGLPYNEFINLGGHLYMSESPSMMHHKFCIIDDTVLLTGSYNWTYYAELRNEENLLLIKDDTSCLEAFKAEFLRLKERIGERMTELKPFPATSLARFERMGFREYLSKDIESRVSYAYYQEDRPKPDVQILAQWLDKAVEIDEQNTTAQQLQQSLAPAVKLKQRVMQSQHTIQQVLAAAPANKTTTPDSVSTNLTQAPVVNKVVLTPPDKIKSAPVTVSPPIVANEVKPVSAPPHATTRPKALPQAVEPKLPFVNPRPSISTPLYASSRVAATSVIVDTKASIPESQDSYLFENLQLVFALDYSNSMEAHGNQGKGGYKLYSTGKVQKAIDMIFAISKGLTASRSIDMFLFEKKAISLPSITESNYHNYVQKEIVQKYTMDGTNIFAPIQAIHNKYTAGKAANINVFVIIITDGENNEKDDNQRIKKYFGENSLLPIFWQFVGLGSNFTFLREVVKVTSNAAFFNLNDVDTVAEEALSIRLLQEFPHWFKQIQDQGRAK